MNGSELSNPQFGLTMLVVGMGGTLVTLWLLTLLIRVITWAFPKEDDGETRKE